MQPIRNRMLKRMDSFILSRANLWDSVNQNHIPTVSFKLLQEYVENVKMIYDHASNIYDIIYRRRGASIVLAKNIQLVP